MARGSGIAKGARRRSIRLQNDCRINQKPDVACSGMAIDQDLVLGQLDALVAELERAKSAAMHSDLSGGLPKDEMQSIAVRFSAAIDRLSPPGSAYRRAAAEIRGHPGHLVQYLGGIIVGMRADFADGYTRSLEELVHAGLFADFLDMALELQEKGFKDPAAVIAGSVLEEHLRRLAGKNGIDIEREPGKPKKADTLNAEIEKAGAYNKLVQKSVTAWLDLRNQAAHGEYDGYDHRQVDALIRDIRDFMIRHPA